VIEVPVVAPRGRLGLRLVLVTVAIGLAAANTGNNLLYLILSLVTGLCLAAVLAARAARRMRVAAHMPSTVVAGQPLVMTAIAEGRFPLLPQTWVQVRIDGLPQPIAMEVAIPSRDGRAIVSTTVTAPGRGRYDRMSVTGHTGYPLDLSTSSSRASRAGPLIVTPAFMPIRSLRVVGDSPAWTDVSAPARPRSGGSGGDPIDRRPLRPHDDARHIDWRASARSGETIVREFPIEAPRRIGLVLDRRARDSESFETCIGRAAAILDLAGRERYEIFLAAEGLDTPLAGPEALLWLAEVSMLSPRAHGPGGDLSTPPFPRDTEMIVLSADPARATPIEMG